ncbi:MAG: CHAT domain-containing protein [Crocosphaera sp.]|nr:CHAT domain-containing protein [Crocosphaera sp.]
MISFESSPLVSSLTLGLVTFVMSLNPWLPSRAQQKPLMIALETVQTQNTGSLQQGQEFYQQGQYSQAIAYWQEALQSAQKAENTLTQIVTLNYLSLAHQALGQWEEAQSTITESLRLINTLSPNTPRLTLIHGQSLNTQGSLYLNLGEPQTAIETWKKAETYYQQGQDQIGVLGTRINRAQALQNLGLYRRSLEQLTQIKQQLDEQADSILKLRGLQGLGLALQAVGNLEQAQTILEEALTLARTLNSADDQGAALLNLGNVSQAAKQTTQALNFYQQAGQTALNPGLQIEAQLNQFRLLINQDQEQTALTLLPSLQRKMANLPPSRRTVYAYVNLGESLLKLLATQKVSPQTVFEPLSQAVEQAKDLNDARATSYALGTLGKLYEQQQEWQTAQPLTEQALQLAQDIKGNDMAYQWQWQLSRLLKVQGNRQGAIATNKAAVQTLQTIRNDLVAIDAGVQFSFRNSVEPVYRNLVSLLLTPETPGQAIPQTNLIQAREVIESLQLAELENFFREACLDAQPKQIDEIDAKAAVIYPIILSDRLGVIVSVAGQPLTYHEIPQSQTAVENTLEELLQALNPAFSNQIRLTLSQQMYDWLIRPIEPQLAQAEIQTLVFVLDGVFRNLPMAALHDGQQYLIENYQVALAPGLQLVDPRNLAPELLQAVVAGVSEANQGFSALPGVEIEVQEIGQEIPTEQLLNQQFTRRQFQDALTLSPLAVVHLATHGQFSSNPDETFVLAWEDTIRVRDFQRILRTREQNTDNPVELLVLSACQTASGDKQAALGLAGMAVRSGARSTIATLWSVKDQSTAQLMTELYRNLNQPTVASQNKAEALRQAQLSLLHSPEFSHPFYWSAFILVGNWL